MPPATSNAKVETRIRCKIIQNQPLNSDWMPRLTPECTNILARFRGGGNDYDSFPVKPRVSSGKRFSVLDAAREQTSAVLTLSFVSGGKSGEILLSSL